MARDLPYKHRLHVMASSACVSSMATVCVPDIRHRVFDKRVQLMYIACKYIRRLRLIREHLGIWQSPKYWPQRVLLAGSKGAGRGKGRMCLSRGCPLVAVTRG
jgi:hypothetical protein